MMTIVTRVKLKEGTEPEWDAAMSARLSAARHRPGWVSAQLLMPLDALNRRVIVGTWETRAAWEPGTRTPPLPKRGNAWRASRPSRVSTGGTRS